MSHSPLYLKGVGMNIRNYKELMLYLYLENSNDMFIKAVEDQYYVSLNKRDWTPITKKIFKQLDSWGVVVCK